MKQDEMREFTGFTVEALVMDSSMVIIGVLGSVENGYARFSSIENIFALVHGKRLSIKFMLSGSFKEIEALLKNALLPCEIFEKCRKIGAGS